MDTAHKARSENRGLRRWTWKLGALTDSAIRLLGGLAKKLKYPALATVPVSAAMLHRVATVSPDASLEDVAQLLVAGRLTELPVVDRGRVVGVVTREDVAQGVESAGPHALLRDAPCHAVFMVEPGDALPDVLARLRAEPEARALVVDHGAPMGLLTADRLAAYIETVKTVA